MSDDALCPITDLPQPPRIHVIGTTGAGKTTFASALARHLAVPHIELDALNWRPQWEQTPTDEFRAHVAQALADETWIADGNYSKARDIIWARANTIIWLDYPLALILRRLLIRTIRRGLTHQELWGGNHESLGRTMFSRDSILLWALKTYRRRRTEYARLLTQPTVSHICVLHFTHPGSAAAWLSQHNGSPST